MIMMIHVESAFPLLCDTKTHKRSKEKVQEGEGHQANIKLVMVTFPSY